MDLRGKCWNGIFVAELEGTISFNDALGTCQRICDAAVLAGAREILIDLLAVKGILTVVERYELALAVSEYRRNRPISKIAVAGKPPTVTGFFAVVSQNRGAITKSFSSREEAVEWLSQK